MPTARGFAEFIKKMPQIKSIFTRTKRMLVASQVYSGAE
jgi:hypothetical protein